MTMEELQIELQNNPRSLNFVRLAEMYLAENMVDEAFQLIERSLKYNPHSISGHLLIARIFKMRDDNEKALEHLNFCVQKAPTNWQALLNRAELHLKMNKAKMALSDFKMVLLHNPQNPAKPLQNLKSSLLTTTTQRFLKLKLSKTCLAPQQNQQLKAKGSKAIRHLIKNESESYHWWMRLLYAKTITKLYSS